MSLFRLDASIRVDGSHSRQIADIVDQEWRSAHPNAPIVRHVGVEPIPATSWATSVFAGFVPESARSFEQREAVTLAATLTDELLEADALLFAVPLYNFGVSQHFKSWVDMVITDPRMAGAPSRCSPTSQPCSALFAAARTVRALPARVGTTRPDGCGASSPTCGRRI
jgi:FMN-dependent NADH-azoreductase